VRPGDSSGERRGRRELLGEARRDGERTAELFERDRGAPPGLDWFGGGGPRELVLRRLLLALRVPARLLAIAASLVPGGERRTAAERLVSRYAFWRGVRTATDRAAWSRLTRGVPILMYHAFTDGGEQDRFVVPEQAFKRQLRALRALRYEVIGLDRFVDAMRTGSRLPRRAVVLTSDDGYVDNLRIALPLLRRRRLPATIFLVSGRLGAVNDWTAEGPLAGRPLLSAEDVGGTLAEGFEIGAHSRNHVSLPDADDEALRAEVEGSREDLEALLARPVRAFAYPYGSVDDRSMAAVADAGFEIGLAVDDRRATVAANPLRVPRIDVCGTDPIVRFLCRVFL
jgi:peptidoglycan/xylan/chitin deacetylase (PgdA/CDA1 family)